MGERPSLFPGRGHGGACIACADPIPGDQVYGYRDPPRVPESVSWCAIHLGQYIRKHYPNGRIAAYLTQAHGLPAEGPVEPKAEPEQSPSQPPPQG